MYKQILSLITLSVSGTLIFVALLSFSAPDTSAQTIPCQCEEFNVILDLDCDGLVAQQSDFDLLEAVLTGTGGLDDICLAGAVEIDGYKNIFAACTPTIGDLVGLHRLMNPCSLCRFPAFACDNPSSPPASRVALDIPTVITFSDSGHISFTARFKNIDTVDAHIWGYSIPLIFNAELFTISDFQVSVENIRHSDSMRVFSYFSDQRLIVTLYPETFNFFVNLTIAPGESLDLFDIRFDWLVNQQTTSQAAIYLGNFINPAAGIDLAPQGPYVVESAEEVFDPFLYPRTSLWSLGSNGCCNLPGDATNDNKVNIADVTFLITRIFAEGNVPQCCREGDANGDGSLNIADVTFLIARIFAAGPAPLCGPSNIACE
ncbi:MAG: hypothetical protein IH914_01545 [candidate division Zixibacteria bacterium]|nr:hypothetical protein [candidate division Zixibacteria bacterium]